MILRGFILLRTRCSFLAAAVCSAGLACSAEPPTRAAPAGAKVANPAEVNWQHHAHAVIEKIECDAGLLVHGDTGRFEFPVTNSGKSILEIGVKPKCGCTVAKFDQSIAPGSTGKISATLNTNGQSGRIRKSMEVSTNDPSQPTILLTLVATIVDPIQVDRPSTHIMQLKAGGTTTEEFGVVIHPTESMRITGAHCEQSYAHVAVERLSEATPPSQVYRVRVTVDPEAPFGRTTLLVQLTTDSPKEPQRTVRLTCEKGIVVATNEIYFGVVRQVMSAPLARNVIIRRNGMGFQIKHVTSSDPHLDASVVEQSPGIYRLTTRYVGGADLGLQKGSLKIETDDPEQPVITVPTSYRVAPPTASNGTTR